MTTVDTARLSKGWALIAEGAEQISLAYAANAQPAAGSSSRPAPVATIDDDLPPLTDADFGDQDAIERATPQAAEKPQNAALGMCPAHRTAWTIKAGGISKNGKPYPPFWRCAHKDGDAWCDKKPTKAWSDSHPIPLEAAA